MSAEPALADTPAPTRVPPWRHVLNGLALVAILVVAWLVSHSAPSEAMWQSPIPVAGTIGEPAAGRNIEATVLDVRAAETVSSSTGWVGATTGVWVVVDARVATVVSDYGTPFGTANLVIGDTTYGASDRPDQGTIAGQSLSTGIPLTGPLMFEVPPAKLTGEAARTATIQLAVDSDPRVDSLIVVPVDLTALEVVPEIDTDEPVLGVTG
ncbi:MAG: hypothetical protein Q7T71_18310 [Herbiconiux sp.]|nr:hypothetical protein [Herbiconiux sp.]